MVWLAGSLLCPLKKIINIRSVIIVKPVDTVTISVKAKPIFTYLTRRNPATSNTISSDNSNNIGFLRAFNRVIIFL